MSSPITTLAPSTLVRTATRAPGSVTSTDSGPYRAPHELLEDQLAAIRMRVEAATELTEAFSQDPHAPTAWPSELLAVERRIDARLHVTAQQLPMIVLRDRFALTATEQQLLWFLIGIELCPLVRATARALSSEQVLDPTTDTIRRVVYGPRSGLDVWREVGPEGTLRRFGAIDRSDESEKTPDHRQTWRVSARVLDDDVGDTALSFNANWVLHSYSD